MPYSLAEMFIKCYVMYCKILTLKAKAAFQMYFQLPHKAMHFFSAAAALIRVNTVVMEKRFKIKLEFL